MKQDGAARIRCVVQWAAVVFFIVCVLAALTLYAVCGGSVWGAPLCWAAAALGIAVPGLFAAQRIFRKSAARHPPSPSHAAGAPYPDAAPGNPPAPPFLPLFVPLTVLWGFALFSGVTLAASALCIPALARVWCAGWGVYAAVCLARPAGRQYLGQLAGRCMRFLQSGAGAALTVTAGALILLNALWAVRYAHPAAVGALVPSQDFFWNLGNVESFANGLPLADLRVAGVTVTYHFLTELYEAGLWFATALPAYDVAAFYAYAPMALALTACLYALGRQLWGKTAQTDDTNRAEEHGRRKCDCRDGSAQTDGTGNAEGELPLLPESKRKFSGVSGKTRCVDPAGRLRAAALACMPLWLSCVSLWKTLSAGDSRFGNSVAVHTLSNINGQATAFLFLALTLLFLDRIFGRICGNAQETADGAARCPDAVWAWASLSLAFYGLAFAKGPQAGIVAIAVLCVLALLCAGRRSAADRARFFSRAALLGVLIPAGFAVLYPCYFAAGAGSSMRFSPTGTVALYYFNSVLNALRTRFPGAWGAFVPLLWLAQSFLMTPAAFCAWVCAAVGDIWKKLCVRPVRLVLHACVGGGLLAFFLFDHYSSSQIYFANLAVFGMGLFLLDSLPALIAGRGQLRRMLRAGVLELTAAGCVTSLCLIVSIGRTAADTLAGKAPEGARCVLTADEERACAFLADNLPEEALFATNRMHTGTALEGLSNVYTGLSGRQAYMESFKYAVSNMGERAGDVQARYAEMEELFSAGTSAARAKEICTARGIHYLLFCPLLPGDESHLAETFPCVFDSPGCRIYQTG